jgi:putative membrane protein
MEHFWSNDYMRGLANYSVVVLCLVVFMAIFELLTRYRNWEEIKKGNLAVAMATGGKIFGIANIFRYSIRHHDALLAMMGWGAFGFVLLMIGYFIFEFLTPMFHVDDEIARDNRAVGLTSMMISIGLSFVIGAGIG